MKKLLFFSIFVMGVLTLNLISALNIDSIDVKDVSPGEEGLITINLENDGNNDVKRLSFNLNFQNPKIIPVGSSEAFIDEIKEDDDEKIVFKFKLANDIPTGTYSLSYNIEYEEDNDVREQSGVIGIVVSAEPELEIMADSSSPIIGQQTRLNARVINKGLADARFVSLVIESDDITILSESSEYIGTIESDDFESTSFDIIYNQKFSKIDLKLTYKNFNNVEQELVKTISLRAYTAQEAVQKGILTKSNASIYVIAILLVVAVFFIIRIVRKKRRQKN